MLDCLIINEKFSMTILVNELKRILEQNKLKIVNIAVEGKINLNKNKKE